MKINNLIKRYLPQWPEEPYIRPEDWTFLDLKFKISFNRVYNSKLELLWNILPIICLSIIAGPSFTLLYMIEDFSDIGHIVQVAGSQWFWTYEFVAPVWGDHPYWWDIVVPEENTLGTCWGEEPLILDCLCSECSNDLENAQISIFRSILIWETIIDYNYSGYGLRLLDVYDRLKIDCLVNTCFLITATDVLHSWAVPSLGLKADACPGRINRLIVWPNRCGVFYGQCSELCGLYHAFMPIVCVVK